MKGISNATKKLTGFNNLIIDWEDGIVYIYEENGSGVEYPAATMEEVIKHVTEYLMVLGD